MDENECILFTDIKSSSKLSAKYPEEMFKNIIKHEQTIENAVKKNNGMVIKTIGDAVMAKFPKLNNGIMCAVDIQHSFVENPIKFNNSDDIIQIRIGIAYGPIKTRKISIQNCKLLDVYGMTVNLASRMESKLSPVGGFAVLADTMSEKFIQKLKKFLDVKVVNITHNCDNFIIRSQRLIPDICLKMEQLHIDDNKEHKAITCELKLS